MSTGLEAKQNLPVKSKLRENIEAIAIAVILALFIRTFIVQAFKIPSGSMQPTLEIGDHILVNKFIYGVKVPYLGNTIVPVKDPQHFDIIVFRYPEDPDKDFIKRLIGVPGDTVEVKNKRVYVNNIPVEHDVGVHSDSHVLSGRMNPRDNFGPVTVPPESYFVMGDNRDNSYDSRFWGFVDKKAIKGKAFIIYWSWNSEAFGVRWGRIGSLLK
ncbi:MAG: signal peptidase I [Desulfobacteraceae bacterium]|nr:MAG: signal peptidase I [Desulfobacteraceae bacterium]